MMTREQAIDAFESTDLIGLGMAADAVRRKKHPHNVVSEAEGRLLSTELDPGKKVKAGDVLAQIDPTDLNIEIEQLQSEYEAAQKRLKIGSATVIDRP